MFDFGILRVSRLRAGASIVVFRDGRTATHHSDGELI
jgi:hypothetical protein